MVGYPTRLHLFVKPCNVKSALFGLAVLTQPEEAVPIYVCRLGDVKEVALSEPGVFVVTDTRDREWYCREGTEDEMNSGFPDPVWEMMSAQRRAHQQGYSQEGTTVRIVRTELNRLASELGSGEVASGKPGTDSATPARSTIRLQEGRPHIVDAARGTAMNPWVVRFSRGWDEDMPEVVRSSTPNWQESDVLAHLSLTTGGPLPSSSGGDAFDIPDQLGKLAFAFPQISGLLFALLNDKVTSTRLVFINFRPEVSGKDFTLAEKPRPSSLTVEQTEIVQGLALFCHAVHHSLKPMSIWWSECRWAMLECQREYSMDTKTESGK
jgi:hypothetical protein